MNKNSTSKTSTDEYSEISQADFDRSVLRKNMQPVEKKQRITIMLDTLKRKRVSADIRSFLTIC